MSNYITTYGGNGYFSVPAFQITANTKVKCKLTPRGTEPNGFWFGAFGNTPFFALFHSCISNFPNYTVRWYYGYSGTEGIAYTASSLNDILNHSFEVECTYNSIKFNGVQTATPSVSVPYTVGSAFGIGYALNSTFDKQQPIDWEYFQIYDGDTLVYDLIPAYNNNLYCFYDRVSGNYIYATGTVDGYVTHTVSISATASKDILDATGETITIEVATENAWTVSGNTWLTLSSTGDTSGDTITATAPNYTGTTNRDETIWFIDSVTGDEAEIEITQNKAQVGQPMYLGGDTIYDFYIGDHQINEMYLGEVLVYSSGPFAGLKLKPSSLTFTPNNEEQEIKIKSSEVWTLTVPAWITASQLTGDTGETIVTLTATTQTASTTGSVEVTTNSYTAETEATYALVNYLDYVHSSNMRNCNGGGNDGDFILTNIVPDNTTYAIVEGREVGYVVGGVLIGYNTNDTNDWRLFHTTQTNWFVDIGNNRCTGSLGTDGTLPIDYNITFGNLYASNSVTSASITGTTWGGTLTGESIKINLAVDWIKRVRIYTQNTLVFDGQAAELEGEYGLYDSVSEELFGSSSFTIVGETTN